MTNWSDDWRHRAACRDEDPELFFSVGEDWSNAIDQRRARHALAICARCPVRVTCLRQALNTTDEWAIAGGTTPAQRHAWRRSTPTAA